MIGNWKSIKNWAHSEYRRDDNNLDLARPQDAKKLSEVYLIVIIIGCYTLIVQAYFLYPFTLFSPQLAITFNCNQLLLLVNDLTAAAPSESW